MHDDNLLGSWVRNTQRLVGDRQRRQKNNKILKKTVDEDQECEEGRRKEEQDES